MAGRVTIVLLGALVFFASHDAFAQPRPTGCTGPSKKSTCTSPPKPPHKPLRQNASTSTPTAPKKRDKTRTVETASTTSESKVGQGTTQKKSATVEQPKAAKSEIKTEEEKIIDSMDFLLMLEFLKDYELISDDT